MLFAGKLNIPFMVGFGIVFTAIFSYLLRLHFQAKKYADTSTSEV